MRDEEAAEQCPKCWSTLCAGVDAGICKTALMLDEMFRKDLGIAWIGNRFSHADHQLQDHDHRNLVPPPFRFLQSTRGKTLQARPTPPEIDRPANPRRFEKTHTSKRVPIAGCPVETPKYQVHL
jgi:hypothetical protein